MRTFSVKNFERFQHYKDRAPPWIKLYNELLDDYDFGLLPDASKMHLIAIWLLASRSENKIPMDPKWVGRRINANDAVDLQMLADRGFIVIDQELRNAEQDASTLQAECLSRERVEEEKSRGDVRPVAKATRSASRFEEFWAEVPKRDGDNPRKPAEKKFDALVKSGVDPQLMIDGMRQACAEYRRRGEWGTRFVPMTVTWLNSQRWIDAAAVAYENKLAEAVVSTKFYAKEGSEQLEAWDAYLRQTKGKSQSRDSRQGWLCDTEWPPGYVPPERSNQTPPIPQMRSMN